MEDSPAYSIVAHSNGDNDESSNLCLSTATTVASCMDEHHLIGNTTANEGGVCVGLMEQVDGSTPPSVATTFKPHPPTPSCIYSLSNSQVECVDKANTHTEPNKHCFTNPSSKTATPISECCSDDSVTANLNNSTFMCQLERLEKLEEFLIMLSKSQIDHLSVNIGNTVDQLSDNASTKLLDATKVLLEELNYGSIGSTTNTQLYNADNGKSFMDCCKDNPLFQPQNCNVPNKPVSHLVQSKNVAPIVCEYMTRKKLVSNKLKTSSSQLKSVRSILSKFNSPKKKPPPPSVSAVNNTNGFNGQQLSPPAHENPSPDSSSSATSSRSSSSTSNNASNEDINTSITSTASTETDIEELMDEKIPREPYRLKPFDSSKKHIIMASHPHEYANRIANRLRANAKKAAFQNRTLLHYLHIYKHFDGIIEEIPNGAPFKPMHRARKRRTFSQLCWMANFDESHVNNNTTIANNGTTQTEQSILNGGGGSTFRSDDTDGVLRARSCRRDYSALFDLSSNDEDAFGHEDHFFDGYDSDVANIDSRPHSTNNSKRPHHATPLHGPRKSYLSKLDSSHDSKQSSQLLDENSKIGSVNSKFQPPRIYDYVILPAELMPVVHIEPIVYKEVVTPIWYMVDDDRMEWIKSCFSSKSPKSTIPSVDVAASDDCFIGDEHFNRMHIEYEIAEKEKLREKANQEHNSQSQNTAPLELPSNDNNGNVNVCASSCLKNVMRARDGRFTKLSSSNQQ